MGLKRVAYALAILGPSPDDDGLLSARTSLLHDVLQRRIELVGSALLAPYRFGAWKSYGYGN